MRAIIFLSFLSMALPLAMALLFLLLLLILQARSFHSLFHFLIIQVGDEILEKIFDQSYLLLLLLLLIHSSDRRCCCTRLSVVVAR